MRKHPLPGRRSPALTVARARPSTAPARKAVFATPQSAAAAVSYVGARLTLLMDAAEVAKKADPGFIASLAAQRRAIERDRYGIVAQVLANRDDCTADRCPQFALLKDANTIKAHLREQAFNGYVTRYAEAWRKGENKSERVAEKPPSGPATIAPCRNGYDFPSAASIPPVSIMNAEPKLPKQAAAPGAEKPTGSIPAPPKDAQNQAAKPPAR